MPSIHSAPAIRLLAAALALALWQVNPARAADERFDILEYRIEGNTVLPVSVIEAAVYPHLGEARAYEQVESARAALERAYHAAGYLTVLVNVPEQRVSDGVVRLQAVEGQVERLRVSGARYYTLGEIKRATPELEEGAVPYFPDVQKQLAEVNRAPGRRITPVLRPGRSPGKVEVELKVDDDTPLHGNVELNNKQSPDTSELRLEAGLRYDNLFQRQHGLGLNYVVSPEATDEVNVFSAFYSLPLGGGNSLSLYAVRSESNVLSSNDSAVVGKGIVLGLRYALPLPGRSAASGFFHSLAAGVDYKDFDETQNILGADEKVSPVRYLPFTVQYTAGSAGEGSRLLGNLSFVFNLRGLSDRDVDCLGFTLDQFDCRRSGARADFAYLRGDLSYSERLGRWESVTRMAFQVAGQPLISNEQFIGGGGDTVRGYLEGEASGDYGWRMGMELKTPPLLQLGQGALHAIAFTEGASLALIDALAGQTSRYSLVSAGLGLRLSEAKGVQFALDVAHPLRDGPRTRKDDDRAHVRVGYQF